MKKVGIVTPYGNNNFGNKLQNYALQEVLKKLDVNPITLINYSYSNSKKFFIIRNLKNLLKKKSKINNREKKFIEFNDNINYSKKIYNAYSKYGDFDYIIAGSDQIWNPNQGKLRDFDILSNVESGKRISYSASFGVSEIPVKYNKKIKKELSKYKMISVRENEAKKIIESLTKRDDIQVVLDPTMLLNCDEWDKIIKKPSGLKNGEKYILNYFLGELSDTKKFEINKIAKECNCRIINLLDKNDEFYNIGPSEFLYLEKNAFLICTDSFHSSVFAILYDRPFLIFDREQKGLLSMNSRIDTLIATFGLTNRKFNGKIQKRNILHDYTEAYKVLEKERIKSEKYLKDALDMNYYSYDGEKLYE